MLSWRALCSRPSVLTDHTRHLLWPMEQEALNALGRGDGARGGWRTEGECRHPQSEPQGTVHSCTFILHTLTCIHIQTHMCTHRLYTHTHHAHSRLHAHSAAPSPSGACVWWGDCTPGCSVRVLVLSPSACLCLSPEHCQRDRPQSGPFVLK